MADEYVLISGLNAKTSPNTSDVLAICDSGGLNTNKITIPNLLGGRLNGIRAGIREYKLFGSDSTGGIGQEVIVGSGLSYSGDTLSGVDANTSGQKGVASFSSDNFSVTGGAVIIKEGGISNIHVASAASIEHSKLATGSGYSVLGVSGGSAGALASIQAGADGHVLRRASGSLGFGTIPTASISDAVTTPTINRLAKTDGTAGYVNALTRETIYIQLCPIGEALTAGTKLRWWVPTHLQNRTIIKAGCGIYTAGSAFTISAGGTLFVSPTGVGGRTDSGTLSKSTGTTYLDIVVGGTPGTAAGVDFWFVIG